MTSSASSSDAEAPGLISAERATYHNEITSGLLRIATYTPKGAGPLPIASNADKDNEASREIAMQIARDLGADTGPRLSAQAAGIAFEIATKRFLDRTFLKLGSLRPGDWKIDVITGRSALALAAYEQYRHLSEIADALQEHPNLKAVIGNDYMISPDIVISRRLVADTVINASESIVDGNTARYASIREVNGGAPILHANVSCKWTIRSDRSQNSRSEALNLIRSRKGRVPHIAIVTGEPLPSRLASVALGTGDIDCVYHFALHELVSAVANLGQSEAIELLNIMIDGRRLRDISDLPLDLAT